MLKIAFWRSDISLEIDFPSYVFDIILMILGGIVRNMFSTVEPLRGIKE